MSRKTLATVIVVMTTLTAGSVSASASDLNATINAGTTTSSSSGSVALDGVTGAGSKSRKRSGNRKRASGNKCDRLRQKAMRTGRHYHWAKYNRCLRHSK